MVRRGETRAQETAKVSTGFDGLAPAAVGGAGGRCAEVRAQEERTTLPGDPLLLVRAGAPALER
ncbi:hypothetical protein ABZ371_32030, partial [Streptomyces sp. NPDC005899]|uniref:hypothetical protein n=1 Tax=Streptomyces sp. NPDC005899 TaxID=3155716 RepID=UPI0033EA9BF2